MIANSLVVGLVRLQQQSLVLPENEAFLDRDRLCSAVRSARSQENLPCVLIRRCRWLRLDPRAAGGDKDGYGP